MAISYDYKKIQEMRGLLFEEMKQQFGPILNIEHLKLLEMRLQTAIMAGLMDQDIRKEKKK